MLIFKNMICNKNLEIDFGDCKIPKKDFVVFDKIIKDRGSVYSVSIGAVESRDDVKNILKKVKNYNKKFQKATHHSYAVRISRDRTFYETKSDDGETGAGNVILNIIKKKRFTNTIVCVTRWFGGIKLESDRFKHIQDATIFALED